MWMAPILLLLEGRFDGVFELLVNTSSVPGGAAGGGLGAGAGRSTVRPG
jgi:hypothetical protein